MSRKHRIVPIDQPIKTGSVGGILANIWRKIMHELGLKDLDRYNALMERYIQRALIDPNRVEKASARASLGKELLKESMTWKTFIKGLNFLNVLKFELRIRLYHTNGKVTDHQLNVSLDEIDPDDSESDDD